MEYTIQQLARLAGVTTRTLRWYDKTGLLPPGRVGENGYRFYGPEQVDRLQQILLYRTLGVELEQIRLILDDPNFDRQKALRGHLRALQEEEGRIHVLIEYVKELILTEERGDTMTDEAKFRAFKREQVEENERKYGQEARKKYGDSAVDQSNASMMGLSAQEHTEWTQLDQNILDLLEKAVTAGVRPEGEMGREVAQLHRKWLSVPLGHSYDAVKHRAIAQMYVADPRFTAYYDRKVEGCAAFLRDAVLHWIKE